MKLHHVAGAALLSAASAVFLAGCGGEHPTDIPSAATMATEGQGRLTYTAPSDGMVYVYDDTTDHLIYSGRVDRGQVVTVQPSNDRISVDGRTAYEGRLPGGDDRRVYFDRSGGERRVIREERIEERRDR
jgi:hypothetical protein